MSVSAAAEGCKRPRITVAVPCFYDMTPRRNELRYAQYNHRLNCRTLRYCSLIEKILGFFRRGEAAKIFRAVIFLTWHRRRNAFEFTQNY